jgi:leader peptidase (prepilin peptidase) / N-methyltransferase
MIIVVLLVFGLCLGSFVNALVWRLRQQERQPKARQAEKPKATRSTINDQRSTQNRYSILSGRSMCPHCEHELAAKDLVPLFSWLSLKGKCRYCGKPISSQYPLVELATALLFVASYTWWPVALNGAQTAIFVLWLAILVGLVALTVYDLRWYLLPNRIMYPLGGLAAIQAVIAVAAANKPLIALLNTVLAVAVGGGIFYVLFQVSGGKWIGGGDVKLGWLLGLIVATPARSLLFIFLAAILGSLVSVPLLATKRLKRTSTIPFGPFLIVAAIVAELFGAHILDWYQHTLLALS